MNGQLTLEDIEARLLAILTDRGREHLTASLQRQARLLGGLTQERRVEVLRLRRRAELFELAGLAGMLSAPPAELEQLLSQAKQLLADGV